MGQQGVKSFNYNSCHNLNSMGFYDSFNNKDFSDRILIVQSLEGYSSHTSGYRFLNILFRIGRKSGNSRIHIRNGLHIFAITSFVLLVGCKIYRWRQVGSAYLQFLYRCSMQSFQYFNFQQFGTVVLDPMVRIHFTVNEKVVHYDKIKIMSNIQWQPRFLNEG